VSLRRLRPAPFRFWLPRAGPLRKAASGLGSRAHSLSDPTRPPNAADSPPANHAASRPNCMRSAHPRTPMISPLIDSCGAASHNGIASVTGFGMINAAGLFARQLLSAENAVSKAAVLDRSETYGADSGADRMGVRFGGNSEVPCRRPGNGPFYEGQHNSSRLHGSLHRCCRDCFFGTSILVGLVTRLSAIPLLSDRASQLCKFSDLARFCCQPVWLPFLWAVSAPYRRYAPFRRV